MKALIKEVCAMLSEEEYDTFIRRCEKAGLSKSAYIRQIISGLQPRDLPPPDYRLMMRQLYRCGNALDQIARKAHALNMIDAQEYGEAVREYRETIAKIEEAVLMPERIRLPEKEIRPPSP